MSTNGFTVDLSTIVIDNTLITSIAPTDRAARVRERVAEMIQPDNIYEITNIDGEPIGTIGQEVVQLNLDEEVYSDGNYEADYCDTEAALDQLLEDFDVAEAVLNLITHPAPDDVWSKVNPVQYQLDYIKEQREAVEERRNEIRAELEEDENNPYCSGYLDTPTGTIAHRPGARCNVHHLNIT